MDKSKQEALEAAGFWVGDAEDFLDLTEEERHILEQVHLGLAQLDRGEGRPLDEVMDGIRHRKGVDDDTIPPTS